MGTESVRWAVRSTRLCGSECDIANLAPLLTSS